MLGLPKVAAAQQQAGVTIPVVPFLGSLEQARVLARPLGQVVDRREQRGEAGRELLVGAKEDVVAAREIIRYHEPIGLAVKERHDPLVHRERVLALPATGLGAKRLGCDHEGEHVGTLDPELDLAAPLDRGPDVLAVHPHVLAALRQRLAQPLDEVLVAARVGDEDIGHPGPPRSSIAPGASRD